MVISTVSSRTISPWRGAGIFAQGDIVESGVDVGRTVSAHKAGRDEVA